MRRGSPLDAGLLQPKKVGRRVRFCARKSSAVAGVGGKEYVDGNRLTRCCEAYHNGDYVSRVHIYGNMVVTYDN